MTAATLTTANANASDRIARDATKAILVILWALLSYAAAFRLFGLGRDYVEYLNYYDSIPPILSFEDTRFEPGFHLFAWFFKWLLNATYDQYSLAVVGAALAIKFYLIYKHLAHPLMAAAVYILLFYPTHEYTQVRAALAIALSYAAIHQWMDRRVLKGLALFALGYSFHTSVALLGAGYLASIYIRGRLAVSLIAAGAAIIFFFANEIYGFILDTFSAVNPLLAGYVYNDFMEAPAGITSVNNMLYTASVAMAVILGWYNYGRYHSTFLTLGLAGVVVLIVFAQSPVLAVRSKELLMVSVVFLMFRSRLTLRDSIPVALTVGNALLLFYLAVDVGLLQF